LAGSADVLLHGNDHLSGDDAVEIRNAKGHFFVVFGVDTAKKQVFFHTFTSVMFL
jgi:hypothetical protein